MNARPLSRFDDAQWGEGKWEMINRRFDSKVRGMINLGGPPVFCARPPFRYRGIPLVHYSSREAFKFVSSNTEIPGQEKPGEF